ncbi:MAG: TMEM165/GDT1 family protein [Thermocrispum sp.]
MSAEVLAFATAFTLVFAVELPDKTLVATLVLTTRYPARAVLAGASAAFAVHVVLAALLGRALSLLPEHIVAAVVATLFAVGAFLLLRESFVSDDDPSADASRSGPRTSFLRSAATSFGVLFAAELGDASQLATAGLTARFGQPVAVALGAWVALVAVAGIAVLLGRKIRARLRPRLLQRVAGCAFGAFAVLAAVQVLA